MSLQHESPTCEHAGIGLYLFFPSRTWGFRLRAAAGCVSVAAPKLLQKSYRTPRGH